MVHLPEDGAPAAASAARPAAAWILKLPQDRSETHGGPLAGLRFAVKDNIDVAGLPTTAACAAFAYDARDTATVVARLLKAGAALAGKTNLDQFACGLNGTRSPFGAVPNAFSPLHVSGGSSSGSAYVVATGQVDFALGTDTAGSGRVPAGLNNIVGFKPSKGLLSTFGVVPAARSVDCVSIFARTVATAARVLATAMGPDARDPYSRDLSLRATGWGPTFTVGIPAQPEYFGDDQSAAAFDAACQAVARLGGEVRAIDYRPLREAASLLYDSALVAERYAAIRRFFDTHEAEVVEPVRSIVGRGRRYGAADVFEAQDRLRALARQAQELWQGIDVMMVPTAPTHVTVAAMQADPVELNRRLGEYTNFVNLLDYAAISVPSSLRADGLPFGVTFIGPCGSDWALLELGQRYHHATGLTLGATGQALPEPEALPAPDAAEPCVEVAVVGAHLSGMPLNAQLTERGARLLRTTTTTADYRLFALPATVPPKPGLLRVAPGTGGPIAVEVWRMPVRHYGSFVALIPPPLGIGTLQLADGRPVQGFLCEAQALHGAEDITATGGWRAYMASRTATASAG